MSLIPWFLPSRYFFSRPAAQSVHPASSSTSLGSCLHLVRYLKGNPTLGLFFPVGASFQLVAYSDSDWLHVLTHDALLLAFASSLVVLSLLENKKKGECVSILR
ncbi:UNVERIFIED_CONTAM: hypothetical protein Sradi_2518300 [Sesamum radiatum]|uniref:Uncharacterized protein n=1 Tax=Sesamum radiatum TaxID=300843 RepID=A0AAW2SLK6_SESRA